MRAYRSFAFVLRCTACASLLAAAPIACGQDVVYVDDLAAPAGMPSRSFARAPQPASGVRMPVSQADYREMSREQVAQALSDKANKKLEEQSAGPFSKFSSRVKGFFSREKTLESAPVDPFVRSAMTQPLLQPRAGVQQAGYRTPVSSGRTQTSSRPKGLSLRQGDRKVGLLDGMFAERAAEPSQAGQPRQPVDTTRQPASWGGGSSVGTAMVSDSSPTTASVPRPLTASGPAKPSDGVVFISDNGPAASQLTPTGVTKPVGPSGVARQRAASGASTPQPMVMISDATPAAKPKSAPRTSTPAPAPRPLVVENPMANQPTPIDQPRPLAEAKPAPVMPVEKPTRSVPKQSVAVLPNPVKVASDQTPQTTERAAALLAEAHTLAASAQTEQDFTRVVQQCRHVLAIDDSKTAVQYSNDLAAWALNKRGELKADEGREPEAMADFEEAVSKDPGRWRAVHNRGVLLAQSGNYTDAFHAFNQTIELNPEFAKAYSNRASLYVQAGEFQTALDDYKKAISLDPDLVIAHKGRGRVCHVLGKMEQALRHFEAAVLLDPTDASIATCRADLLTDMGRYAQAAVGYSQAIAIDPLLSTAYRNLAWLQATCPEPSYRDARQSLLNAQHAMQLSGGVDDICLDTLAAAQAATGDFDSAVETIKRAISLAPASDQQEYQQRLELYQSGEPFLTEPADIRQASYNKTQTK